MVRKIALNTPQALHGRAGEALRRSLVAMPGVKQVTVSYPNRVEVQFDGTQTKAGSLMTVVRLQGMGV